MTTTIIGALGGGTRDDDLVTIARGDSLEAAGRRLHRELEVDPDVGGRIAALRVDGLDLIGIGGVDPRSGRPYTYVETIAGGQGGRPMGPGQDGIQCNMTNTMNTPIEALEIGFPLRVRRYELREGSGGTGKATEEHCNV